MICHNFFADTQPDAGAGIFGFSLESLKYLEYFSGILLFKPNTVVLDPDLVVSYRRVEMVFFFVFSCKFPTAYVNHQGLIFFTELNGVV